MYFAQSIFELSVSGVSNLPSHVNFLNTTQTKRTTNELKKQQQILKLVKKFLRIC